MVMLVEYGHQTGQPRQIKCRQNLLVTRWAISDTVAVIKHLLEQMMGHIH
jgi:hypothetical protein